MPHGPIVHRGHAIECRINADIRKVHPGGRITTFNPRRVSVLTPQPATEGVIPPYYDSLIVKLIVRGGTVRGGPTHVARLENVHCRGIHTIPLHRKILHDPDFVLGTLDTGSLSGSSRDSSGKIT